MNKIEIMKDESLVFVCPVCKAYHRVEIQPHKATGWSWNGDLEKPTIKPSILAFATRNDTGARKTLCHLFVTDGRIQFCTDSPHELAGKTVDMYDITPERSFL